MPWGDWSWCGPLILTVTPTRTFQERAIEKPHGLSVGWSGCRGSYFLYAVTVRRKCSKCGRFSELLLSFFKKRKSAFLGFYPQSVHPLLYFQIPGEQ